MRKQPNFKPGRPHNARKHKRVLGKKHLGRAFMREQMEARRKAANQARLDELNAKNAEHGAVTAVTAIEDGADNEVRPSDSGEFVGAPG